MQIKEIAIEKIKPYNKNPRKNDKAVDAVKNSIISFGFKVPIVIDKDNVIIAGHTRLKAAQKLNLQVVPCVIADDLTPEQVRAFRLADNKTAELADWNFALLDSEIKAINDVIYMGDFGFDVSAGGLRRMSWSVTEKRCNLKKMIKQHSQGDIIYSSFFESSKDGTPLTQIKEDVNNVYLFADNLCDFLDKTLGGNLQRNNWCICTTPRRRHKEDFHFSTEICRSAAAKLNLIFIQDCFVARTRNRILPDFTLVDNPQQPNVILYDDIITTGVTLTTCRNLLVEALHSVFCVVAIKNRTFGKNGGG